MNKEELISTASRHIGGLLELAFNYLGEERAVVVYDDSCELSAILSEAYRHCLPNATFVDFNKCEQEEILELLASLGAMDLVVLIQAKNFRLDAFRIRVELFKRKIKVLEHPHLKRMSGEELTYYIDSLEYDINYYRGVGRKLENKINNAKYASLESDGELLVYGCALENAKLNIGDYSNMNNVGGQFPIGEVFTEATDFDSLNGRVKIFIFGDTTYRVNRPQTPITLIIRKGQVVDCENSTPDFDNILNTIRADEKVVWVRELGLGLNRAFTKDKTVSDLGTYERMCGVHMSLGAKHGMYAKPGFKRGGGKYHVDVFVDTTVFKLNEEVVYKEGAWIV